MAGGRKRARSNGAVYGQQPINADPETYGLEWTIEHRGPRTQQNGTVSGTGQRLPTRPLTVLRVWEYVARHTLPEDRVDEFLQRYEVSELAVLAPIRVWAGARKASAAHAQGHLLLSEWLDCAKRVSLSEMAAAQPSFKSQWDELVSPDDGNT